MSKFLRKRRTQRRLDAILEKNNALEGVLWPLEKRLKVAAELYDQYRLLTPYRYKPFVKTFNSFREYENWRKRQRNPWFF